METSDKARIYKVQSMAVAELSVRCELVSTWRADIRPRVLSGHERLRLGQCSLMAFPKRPAIDEETFLGKVVVDRGVNLGELLQ
jgi:hypothetical protein